jgi:hypothetical protein
VETLRCDVLESFDGGVLIKTEFQDCSVDAALNGNPLTPIVNTKNTNYPVSSPPSPQVLPHLRSPNPSSRSEILSLTVKARPSNAQQGSLRRFVNNLERLNQRQPPYTPSLICTRCLDILLPSSMFASTTPGWTVRNKPQGSRVRGASASSSVPS